MPTARTAPKKTAASVDFDISVAEAEANDGERPKPFTVRLKSGKIITLKDPEALDWQVAADLNSVPPRLALESLVEESDFEDFFAERFSATTLRRLMASFADHYELLPPGE